MTAYQSNGAGTTGTGLDKLVDIILNDPAWPARVGYGLISRDDIEGGAAAADGMNNIIIDGIKATGIAGDGRLDGSEMRALNSYIRDNEYDAWLKFHGDDEGNVETGFHLVQGDGAATRIYGKDAVDTVADEIYHLGFTINGKTLENEDGNANQSINVVAGYLNKLLANDLEDGSLAKGGSTAPATAPSNTNTTTNTSTAADSSSGLDTLVDRIVTSPGLQMRVKYGQLSQSQIETAANAAAEMNDIIIEAIGATGVAKDGHFSGGDVRDLQGYIHGKYASEWAELHGNDTNGQLTGFHIVRNWGYDSELLGRQAICHVAEEVYQLGFDRNGRMLENEDGDQGQSVNVVARYLNGLLDDELAAGEFDAVVA